MPTKIARKLIKKTLTNNRMDEQEKISIEVS
jgi:hypothetical protein